MPRNPAKKSFDQAQDASWVQETYQRLDDVAAQLQGDDSPYPSSEAWMRAGTQDLEALRSGQPWSAASSSSGAHRPGEETSDLLYRATDEGLLATGFNPWRHTWYVTGRPVQVHCVIPSMYAQCQTVPLLNIRFGFRDVQGAIRFKCILCLGAHRPGPHSFLCFTSVVFFICILHFWYPCRFSCSPTSWPT